ncbi:MAG TPA: insulinase family protein, partial [Pyrinomonadaceae bacterium]|nr:insulinase family protein [Pyrinomonadaceae bacterium]
ITPAAANAVAEKLFGGWPTPKREPGIGSGYGSGIVGARPIVRKITVIDLPDSGQAAVNFYKPIIGVTRGSNQYYSASVLNSLLGGGYSSRLNQEIRIKRGLSYGAGSSFSWRRNRTNFSARTQTKNESAPEVAELMIAELKRLTDTDATETELNPRRLVLTGGFGRNLETTGGLAAALSDLYSFGIAPSELNAYMPGVTGVSSAAVKDFAAKNLFDGEMIIVGDYSIFKDDLAKRFPGMKIEVVKASELNIESPTLKKSDIP